MNKINLYRWNRCLLTTAYFPPIDFFVALANSNEIFIESKENFQKQSYRNRTNILSANGVLSLSIPIKRGGELNTHKIAINQIEIDYSVDWVIQHKRAIEAAYMNSPFFIYYKDDIFSILDKKIAKLFDLNSALIEKLVFLCGINKKLSYTENFENYISNNPTRELVDREQIDLRGIIHPKYNGESLLRLLNMEKPYWQVFTKQGFITNLSILDLLFNEGPNSISFLMLES